MTAIVPGSMRLRTARLVLRPVEDADAAATAPLVTPDIAANLSTFTAHLENIRDISNTLEPPALILLDEVGTGTDPEEGSALGVAMVDYFCERLLFCFHKE